MKGNHEFWFWSQSRSCRWWWWWWWRLLEQQIPWLQTGSHTPRASSAVCLNLCTLSPSPLYLLHTALKFLQLFSLFIHHTVTPLYNVLSQPLLAVAFFRWHKRLIITWHIDVDILSKGFISICLCIKCLHLYMSSCRHTWACQPSAYHSDNQTVSSTPLHPYNWSSVLSDKNVQICIIPTVWKATT